MFYRKALGDDRAAIDDTHYFVKQYGAKHPREAAEAFWSLTPLYERQGNVAKA